MAQSTESSTRIAAPPPAVLDVIAELGDYPSWAGGISSVEVLQEQDGWPTRARFVVNQPPIKDSYVLDYTWDVGESGEGLVSWTLAEKGSMISKLDGSYRLSADGDATTVVYRLAVDLSIPMPGMIKRKAERTIVSTALSDLTKQVLR